MKICAAIDQKLMQYDILRLSDLSLDKGIEGWLHYILAHMQGVQHNEESVFDKTYLQTWLNVCRHLLNQNLSPSLQQLCTMFVASQQGCPIHYNMNLSAFVNPVINWRTPFLGLHNGLAGLLLSIIHNQKS